MRRDAGFSLVEVMAAMFIAALAAAAVIVSLPPGVSGEEQAAQRLATALTRAQRAAVIQGASIGLIVAHDSYRFAVWDGGRWRDLDRAQGFPPQPWPHGVLVGAQTESLSGEDMPEGFPVLVFDETGAATPFLIRLSGADGRASVRGDAAGGIAVETPDA